MSKEYTLADFTDIFDYSTGWFSDSSICSLFYQIFKRFPSMKMVKYKVNQDFLKEIKELYQQDDAFDIFEHIYCNHFENEKEEEEEEGDDGRMVLDEGDNGSRKKTQDHKKKMKSLYASAEEFEAMLAEAAQAREEMEKKRQQKRGNRGGRGGRGGKRGGFRGKRRRWSVCCNKQERLPSSYGKTSSVASRSIHEFDNKTPTTSICDKSLTLIFKSQYWWFSGTMLPTSMFRYCSSAREKSPRRREERIEDDRLGDVVELL